MGRWSGWGLWLCLALGLVAAAWAVCVRDPLPVSAPADVFSAGRAMADVRLVGREAHPTGTPANERVRLSLLARMEALGLRPQVREAVGLHTPKTAPGQLVAGVARSLVGVLPGSDPKLPAVVVMAHLDSVPNSPGAADDGAGVASALEIARMLRATGPHRRDVIVLLTDGEEAGLLGAEAFFSGDPLAPHVGAVVNMEARGDAGRASMFETGRDDAGMIAFYAAHSPAPFANSLTAFLYHRLPNNTDFTNAFVKDLSGLNFAFSGDQLAYHTPLSTPDHLSQQSLQHMGDQAAPAVRALADAVALPARAPDVVYFDLFGRTLVRYPPSVGWLVWGGGVAFLLLAFVGPARGRRALDAPGLAGDAARGLAAAFAATAAALLVGHAAGRWLDGGGYAAGYHLYRSYALLFVGAALLALGAALAAYAGASRGRGLGWIAAALLAAALTTLAHGFDAFAWIVAAVALVAAAVAGRRPVTAVGGWLGALVLVGIVAGALQATAPLTAPLAAWPFLVGAIGAAAWSLAPMRVRPLATVLAMILAVFVTAMLGALAEGMFTVIGPALPEVLAVFVLLMLCVLAPFAIAWSGLRFAGGLAAALLAVGVLAVLVVGTSRSSAARPGLADALYLVPAQGAQLRVAPIPRLDRWSRAALTADGGKVDMRALPPLFPDPAFQATAVTRPVAPPILHLDRVGGEVRLTALATGGGRAMRLFVRSAGPIGRMIVNGRLSALSARPNRWAVIDFAAPPATGVALSFTTPPASAVEARVFEQRDGWPQGAAPPAKPADLMAWRDCDTTIAEARATLP